MPINFRSFTKPQAPFDPTYDDAARQRALSEALKVRALQVPQNLSRQSQGTTSALASVANALLSNYAGTRSQNLENAASKVLQGKNEAIANSMGSQPSLGAVDSTDEATPITAQYRSPQTGGAVNMGAKPIVDALAGQDPRIANQVLLQAKIARAFPAPAKYGVVPAGGSTFDESTGQLGPTAPKDASASHLERRTRKLANNMAQDYNFDPSGKPDVNVGDPYKTSEPAAIQAANSVDPKSLQFAADTYRTTGAWPANFSRSPLIQSRALAIVSHDAEANGDTVGAINARHAARTANTSALSLMEKQGSAMDAAEKGASKNFDLVIQKSNALGGTQSPLMNKAWQAYKRGIEGSPDVKDLVIAIKGAQSQYAKVLQGAYGAAGITDTSARDAQDLFNQFDNPAALVNALKPGGVARTEMANRTGGIHDTQAQLRTSLGILAPGIRAPANAQVPQNQPETIAPPMSNDDPLGIRKP